MYGRRSDHGLGPGLGHDGARLDPGLRERRPWPGPRQGPDTSSEVDQGNAFHDNIESRYAIRDRLGDDTNSFDDDYNEFAANGPLEGPNTRSSGIDGAFVHQNRVSSFGRGGPGLGSGRPPWRNTHDHGFEDDEEDIVDEGDFDDWPAFGGVQTSEHIGSPSRDSRGTRFPEIGGDRPFGRSLSHGGGASSHDDLSFGGDDFDNTLGGYVEYNAGWGDEFPSHGYGSYGIDDGLGFDPEFLDGAIGEGENLDDVISRMMDAQAARGRGGAAPASDSVIASLKKKKVDRSMLDAEGKGECSVCMEDVSTGEEVTELPCKHWFHNACINHWLSSHGTCPHCRESVTLKEQSSTSVDPRPPGGPQNRAGLQHSTGGRPRYDEYRPMNDDEAFARRLQEQNRPSAHDDEALARILQEQSDPPVYDDEALARRLQQQSRPSVHEDAALARLLQQESELPVHDDEEMARRLQEEADRERDWTAPD